MGFRGSRIRELREALRPKLSQKALGVKADVSQATISRLELDEVVKRPDRAVAVRIARVLGVKLSEVWEDIDGEELAPVPYEISPPAVSGVRENVAIYEKALFGAASTMQHVDDFDPARAALRQVIPLLIDPVDPERVASEWLTAVAALREAGRDPTPLAIVAHVAMAAIRRAASPSAAPAVAAAPKPKPKRKSRAA